jgi:hypothetical protein
MVHLANRALQTSVDILLAQLLEILTSAEVSENRPDQLPLHLLQSPHNRFRPVEYPPGGVHIQAVPPDFMAGRSIGAGPGWQVDPT